MKKNISLRIIDLLTALTIILFIVYSFWFQYAAFVIDGALILFGIFFIIFIAFYLIFYFKRTLLFLKNSIPFLLFVALLLFETIVFSIYKAESISAFSSILKYALPCFAIVIYVGNNLKKFRMICFSFLFSFFALCISIYLNPAISRTGAISVGALNTNTLSSFLLIQLFSGLFLLIISKKTIINIPILIILFFGLYTQFNAASRRGVIVYILVFVSFLIIYAILKAKKDARFIFVLLFLLAFIPISTVLLINTFAQTFMNRLFNPSDVAVGDSLRSVYQTYAISLFSQRPLFGSGLNSVAYEIGMYSHNLYTEILACAGIAGMIAFAFLMLILAVRLINASHKENNAAGKMFFVIPIIIICSILISGYAVVQIYDLYFYLLIGLIISTCNLRKSFFKPVVSNNEYFVRF